MGSDIPLITAQAFQRFGGHASFPSSLCINELLFLNHLMSSKLLVFRREFEVAIVSGIKLRLVPCMLACVCLLAIPIKWDEGMQLAWFVVYGMQGVYIASGQAGQFLA